jgi:pyruvate/2-oxoglutarate dehydrogenase complex dihydrolipoamide acyltransferase (E2) component
VLDGAPAAAARADSLSHHALLLPQAQHASVESLALSGEQECETVRAGGGGVQVISCTVLEQLVTSLVTLLAALTTVTSEIESESDDDGDDKKNEKHATMYGEGSDPPRTEEEAWRAVAEKIVQLLPRSKVYTPTLSKNHQVEMTGMQVIQRVVANHGNPYEIAEMANVQSSSSDLTFRGEKTQVKASSKPFLRGVHILFQPAPRQGWHEASSSVRRRPRLHLRRDHLHTSLLPRVGREGGGGAEDRRKGRSGRALSAAS